MLIQTRFPGGVAVEASVNGLTVRTDQPVKDGGEGSAPSPFDLFFASIATCAGFYALRFCQERQLDTEGLGVTLTTHREPGGKRVARVRVDLTLPRGFPEKYRAAILRATEQCAVKRHILEPPEFTTVVQTAEEVLEPVAV